MNYTILKNIAHLNIEEVKRALEHSNHDYVLFEAFMDETAQLQMDAFIQQFPEQMKKSEIHFFQSNPKYLNWMKKATPEEMAEKETLAFVNNARLGAMTYFEHDPFMVLPENYSYILFAKPLIQLLCNRLTNEEPIDMLIYEALTTSASIAKQRMLEKETLKDKNLLATDNVVEKSVEIYTKWLEKQVCRNSIKLFNQKYQVNMLNYFIRVYIGPQFKDQLQAGNIEAAAALLGKLDQFLRKQKKAVVSELISLGYFFIHFPVTYYHKLYKNKAFMKVYLEFSKFLFAHLHYDTRQYYLRYYRHSTNALYKAVRLRSKRPLKKCNKLYFTNKQ